jgi:hypothetical protein
MAGDTKGLFWLVRLFRESLQDNKIQPVSDWGSSGRRFKSRQPDAGQRRFLASLTLYPGVSAPPDAPTRFSTAHVSTAQAEVVSVVAMLHAAAGIIEA